MIFELTTLGEYARVQGGYAYKSKDFSESGACPVLKIKNVRFGTVDYSEASLISEEIANETGEWKTKEGDILISMTGSGPNAPQSLVGRVARIWGNEPEAWINQRVGRVVLKEEKLIHPDFLFYLLASPSSQDYLVSNSSGSANQANISGKTIESLPCPKVGYEKSAAIAKILRELDQKILTNRQTNQTLEHIAQAIFKSWFVDFEPTRAKIAAKQIAQARQDSERSAALKAALFADDRWPEAVAAAIAEGDPERAAMAAISGKSLGEIDQLDVQGRTNVAGAGSAGATQTQLLTTAALFPDALVDSELGEIPEGWDVAPLSSWGEIICGKTPSKKKDTYYGGGIPFIKIPDMHGNMYVVETIDSLTEGGAATQKKKLLPKGSVCVSCIATVGQVIITSEESFTNQQINSIVPSEKSYSPYLYFSALNLYDLLHDLASGGSATLNLNTGNFSKIAIIKPHNQVVKNFADIIDPLMKQILENYRQQEVLSSIRDSLLPKLLSGEIEIGEGA